MTIPARPIGLQAGSVLAGYRLEAEVGAGGMAVVWRARDERLGRLVALKILAPALALDSEFRQRFIAESRAAATVDDPSIIPVYEAGEAEGVLFIAMRFVQGGDLRQILLREGALRPDRVMGFIIPVASALDAAHRVGLVHRDVKPGNILVDAREDRPDHVYLSDFGIVKSAGLPAGLTGTKQFIGTPAYAAPEQIRGQAVDGRADQYALACVTYELLTGVLPFEPGIEVLLAHLSEPAPSAVSRMPDLPGAVDQVLAAAMAKAPEKRYASCLDFAGALQEALGLTLYGPRSPGTAPAVPQAPATPPSEIPSRATAATVTSAKDGTATAWIRRHHLPALALACAILAAAGIIAFVLTSPPHSAGPANSPSRPSSPRPATSPSYSRSGIDLPYAGSDVLSLAFSPSGNTLAIDSNYICLWNIATTGCTTPSVFSNENSVAFSPDGKIVAAGNGTGRTVLWNVAAGKPAATLADPGSKGVDSVAFSSGGKILAAGDFNGRTYLWDVATGRLTATLADPSSKGVDSVAFSPDGRTLAAGDGNGRTYLWSAAGKLIATLTDPGSRAVNAVAFSPDGTTLATGDESGSFNLWRIS